MLGQGVFVGRVQWLVWWNCGLSRLRISLRRPSPWLLGKAYLLGLPTELEADLAGAVWWPQLCEWADRRG